MVKPLRLLAVGLAVTLAACGTEAGSGVLGGATSATAADTSSTGPTSQSVDASSPSPASEASEEGSAPTLRILSPQDGDALGVPFEVRYEVTGFEIPPDGAFLHVTMVGIVDPILFEVPLDGPSGTVLVGDKRMTGRRVLRFTLAGPGHRDLHDPEATVIVYGLTISGPR